MIIVVYLLIGRYLIFHRVVVPFFLQKNQFFREVLSSRYLSNLKRKNAAVHLDRSPLLNMSFLFCDMILFAYLLYTWYMFFSLFLKVLHSSSCEIEGSVETYLCELCVLLRSPCY